MPRFENLLSQNMKQRGHDVQVWSSRAKLSKFSFTESINKWLRYSDQYIFQIMLRNRIKKSSKDTLFVVTDHSLGLYIPAIANRPHLIHCHDFLAQRTALGHIPGTKLSWTGKIYQYLIRRGFKKGKNFVSVSNKTQEELHQFLKKKPLSSTVVYNGLNQPFFPGDAVEARRKVGQITKLDLSNGYLFHIGGNQWYKNRKGVIDIYDAWRKTGDPMLPLLMIGQSPEADLIERFKRSPFKDDIHLLTEIDDETVRFSYVGASLLLFPSFAEGFGWPIAEAMASGCPVITTDEAPMTEVAANAGFLIPPRPYNDEIAAIEWAMNAANVVSKVINLSPTEKKNVIEAGLINAKRFDLNTSLDTIETLYKKILQSAL